MKFANLMLSIITLISMAGCSDGPSDRDVRRSVRKITGNCKYFTVTHVLKVNWAIAGTPDYQVDIQYSIQVAPLPDAKNVTAPLTQPVSVLTAHLAALGIERDKNFNANADFLDRIAHAQDAGDEPLALSYEAQRAAFVTEKLEPGIRQARELAAEKARVIGEGTSSLRDAFFQACPKTSAAVYEQMYGNAELAQYTEGYNMDFATTVRMTKADKGWQIKE